MIRGDSQKIQGPEAFSENFRQFLQNPFMLLFSVIYAIKQG